VSRDKLKEGEWERLKPEERLRVWNSVNSRIQKGEPLALGVDYYYWDGLNLDGNYVGNDAARVAQVETGRGATLQPTELLLRKGETLEVTLPDGQTLHMNAIKAVVRRQ
jgi:hypothetical protein